MIKIINPWKDKAIFHCIGCSEKNPIGLKLAFYDNDTEIVSYWNPDKNYEGYINVVHGGIQSTLHDEIASWVVYTKGKTAGVTTELNVRFLKAVYADGGQLKITGKLVKIERKFMTIETQLFNTTGELCSEATVVYRVYSQQMAMAKMHYPGVDAFYESK